MTREIPEIVFSCLIHDVEDFNRVLHNYEFAVSPDESERDLHNGRIVLRLSSSGGEFYRNHLEAEIILGEFRNASFRLGFSFPIEGRNSYFLMPAAAYNGNRFEKRRIPYSPKILDEKDLGEGKRILVSDIPGLNPGPGPSFLYDRSGSLSLNMMAIYDPFAGRTHWLVFEPRNGMGDLGIFVKESSSRDQLKVYLTSPVVRELYKYTICDNQSPSDDVPAIFTQGDRLEFRFSVETRVTRGMEEFWRQFRSYRSALSSQVKPEPGESLSECFHILMHKFNRDNWVENAGYYSVGMRENFLQDWQLGWTGGMISTYPLYLQGDSLTRQRVLRNFDWFFRDGFAPSGLFWDSGEEGFIWYGGDIRRKATSTRFLVRKAADGLFYIMKQLYMFRDEGVDVPSLWIEKLEGVAGIFLQLMQKAGTPGQFIDTYSGDIVIGGSTSGALMPAGLLLLYRWTGEQKWFDLARQMAQHFYDEFLVKGISCGGPGDALQNPDSESAYGLLESFVRLYEFTSDSAWLHKAETAAAYFSSWVMAWNYDFPAGSELGRLKVLTCGTVWANTQNKHAAPGICCYSGRALLDLYRFTGNKFYLDLLVDICRAMPQFLSTAGRPVEGLKTGWMSERVSTTDWFEGIGEIMKGSTWSETSLMLSYAEIPGVYVDTRNNTVVSFDSIHARLEQGSLILEDLSRPFREKEIKLWIDEGWKKGEFHPYGCLTARTVKIYDRLILDLKITKI